MMIFTMRCCIRLNARTIKNGSYVISCGEAISHVADVAVRGFRKVNPQNYARTKITRIVELFFEATVGLTSEDSLYA